MIRARRSVWTNLAERAHGTEGAEGTELVQGTIGGAHRRVARAISTPASGSGSGPISPKAATRPPSKPEAGPTSRRRQRAR